MSFVVERVTGHVSAKELKNLVRRHLNISAAGILMQSEPHALLSRRTDDLAKPSELGSRIFQRLKDRFYASQIVNTLNEATEGDLYVFGGTIRRILFENKQSGDLDVMVPNGDFRAFRALQRLSIPFTLNRHKHHRYNWNTQQIDLFQPREFYNGYPNVHTVLQFVDLKICSLAIHLQSGQILDPFKVLNEKLPSDPGINWRRWERMSDFDLSVLTIRLLKVIHEAPKLTISTDDADRLRREILPRVTAEIWPSVGDRFPLGRKLFFEEFQAKVLDRARVAKH